MPRAGWDRALVALAVGFGVLTFAVLAAILLFQAQQRDNGWVRHTLRVQNQLALVMGRLQEAESSQRGYVITANPVYLAPYRIDIGRLPQDLADLRDLVADNAEQASRFATLDGAVKARIASLNQVLTLDETGHPDQAREIIRLNRGKVLMDQVSDAAARMDAAEQALLVRRAAAARRGATVITGGLALSTLLTLALGGFAFADGRRRVKVAEATGRELEAANALLISEMETRAEAEAQVRQMQKMEAVGQLTGGIAHDFNNMLAIIIGSLDVAKRRITSDIGRVEVCLDNALEAAQRAAQLTGRLLAFSRQQPLAPRVLDGNKLVGGMAEMLRRTVGENLRVETVLAGGLWTTFADPGQLESALLNLCVNARDAMPGGGRLTIETANTYLDDEYTRDYEDVKPGQYVQISVTDTGAGMPPEVVERAFDPFYTTKGVGRGTGLGLSQVHGFVKQSGGHVKIYSEPGVGTSVKLYLPRSLAAESAPERPVDPAAVPRAAGEEIVLVVEDEERVRHLSVDALRELGYVVVQAADATQALTVLQMQPRVDLLFTDIVMPDMNGRRLADKARETRPDLKVLYTTGYTRNAIVHNGVLDAGVAFLPKPFTLDQLARKVREILDAAETATPA